VKDNRIRFETKRHLEDRLFGDPGVGAFAVVDAARWPAAQRFLHESGEPYTLLASGDLDTEIEAVSPHLVTLREDSSVFDTLFDEGWGQARGVFVAADASLSDLRAHLAALAYFTDAEGMAMLFRFYDPRVLRTYWPEAAAAAAAALFGEAVIRYLAEDEDGGVLEIVPRNG